MNPSKHFRAQAPCTIDEGQWFVVDLDTAAVLVELPPDGKVAFTKPPLGRRPFLDTPDAVNHPSHYNTGRIEVAEMIEDQQLGFHLGNVVKYICRAGRKDPAKTVEDLKKARWYLDRQIELETAKNEGRAPCRPNDMKGTK